MYNAQNKKKDKNHGDINLDYDSHNSDFDIPL